MGAGEIHQRPRVGKIDRLSTDHFEHTNFWICLAAIPVGKSRPVNTPQQDTNGAHNEHS